MPELLSVLGSYQAGPIKLLTQLGPEVDNTENTVVVHFETGFNQKKMFFLPLILSKLEPRDHNQL